MSDYPEIFNQSNPRAIKDHKCSECSGKIKKGENYQYVSGLWDEWSTIKTCTECAELREDIHKGFYEWSYGDINECVSEMTRENPFLIRFIKIMQKRCDRVHPSWTESA